MADKPTAGLILNYDFVWKDEANKGRVEGAKDRPCMIVRTRKDEQTDTLYAYVLPITHTPPQKDQKAVEIPYQVGRQLGLDHDRMWIKTHEVNRVEWPARGYPFGVTPNRQGQMTYGVMRHDVGKQAFQSYAEQARERTLEQVNRDDELPTRPEPTPTQPPRPVRQQRRTLQQRGIPPRGRGGGGGDRSC